MTDAFRYAEDATGMLTIAEIERDKPEFKGLNSELYLALSLQLDVDSDAQVMLINTETKAMALRHGFSTDTTTPVDDHGHDIDYKFS